VTAPQPLSRDEIADFAVAMGEAFVRAAERQPLHRMRLDIGEVAIALDFAGSELVAAFQPALAGMRERQDDVCDVKLSIFDCTASGVEVPEFGRPVQELIGRRGECASAPDGGKVVVVDFDSSRPSVIDFADGSGVVAIGDVHRLPSWALAAPLRAQLALLLQPRGIQFAHGAAVGRADGVIFLTGYGGSGKSTTALSAHRRRLTVLGDDYVALKAPDTVGALPTVHRIYSSIKIRSADTEQGGALHSEEKLVLFPFVDEGGRLCDSAPCVGFWDAALSPEVTSWLEPRHAEDVAPIAIASTGLQIPGDDVEMARLVRLCAEAAPTRQRLHLGSDRESVIDVIEQYLEGVVPARVSAPYPAWSVPHALRPISVIIPVYNGARFIAEALRDVHEQAYPALEVVIVDDGSTDELDAALAQIGLPFRLIRQDNSGPAAARNAGIAAASGEWIAFQDVDDLWTPGTLHRLAKHLILHPNVPVVHGGIATLYPSSEADEWIIAPSNADAFPFTIGAGLYRRSIFDQVGGFDESLRYGEDIEWFARLRLEHPSVMIPDVVVHRRRHRGNMTNDRIALARGHREALAKVLAHRMRARRQGFAGGPLASSSPPERSP